MMSSFIRAFVCLALLLACTVVSANQASPEPSKIRFYTGNLSVGYFMDYWGTGKQLPGDVPTLEYCEQMKSVSVSAVTDIPAWCRVESEPGKWDWSFYEQNEQILHQNGLKYNVFSWLHFAPKWFMETPEYVPYRCVEHNQPTQQTSLWAPGTLKIYDRYYKQLATHFGDKIDFIRLATPAEYGEIGYPNGMTNWLVKQEHSHAGFWCNDFFARANFKAVMKKRYRTIASLNKSWDAKYKSFNELAFPEMAKDRTKLINPLDMTPGERRRVFDFIGWYYDSQAEFTRKAVGIVRKYFPNKEIIISMGYGSQLTAYGNDDVGIAKMCRDMKISCQTPGNIPYFCMKSLSTPCRFYGVPYFTEPPGGMNPNQEVDRIWSDASCGTQTYFDYPDNLMGAKDVFAKYGRHLTGKQAIVDVAVFFPTTDHRLRDKDWPLRTFTGANALREFLDYDLVDERMICDGALKKYKLLLMYDGNIVQESTLAALEKWLSTGGVILIKDFGKIETVDGNTWASQEQFFKTSRIPLNLIHPGSVTSYLSKVGKGCVIMATADQTSEDRFAEFAAAIAYNLSKRSPGVQNIPMLDETADGVSATLFADRILYLNPSDKIIEKVIILRKSDFPANGRTGRPERFAHILKLEPHSIGQIDLK